MTTIFEPFRVKSVEPLKMTTAAQRREYFGPEFPIRVPLLASRRTSHLDSLGGQVSQQ